MPHELAAPLLEPPLQNTFFSIQCYKHVLQSFRKGPCRTNSTGTPSAVGVAPQKKLYWMFTNPHSRILEECYRFAVYGLDQEVYGTL
jgi:hypothetical protein